MENRQDCDGQKRQPPTSVSFKKPGQQRREPLSSSRRQRGGKIQTFLLLPINTVSFNRNLVPLLSPKYWEITLTHLSRQHSESLLCQGWPYVTGLLILKPSIPRFPPLKTHGFLASLENVKWEGSYQLGGGLYFMVIKDYVTILVNSMLVPCEKDGTGLDHRS